MNQLRISHKFNWLHKWPIERNHDADVLTYRPWPFLYTVAANKESTKSLHCTPPCPSVLHRLCKSLCLQCFCMINAVRPGPDGKAVVYCVCSFSVLLLLGLGVQIYVRLDFPRCINNNRKFNRAQAVCACWNGLNWNNDNSNRKRERKNVCIYSCQPTEPPCGAALPGLVEGGGPCPAQKPLIIKIQFIPTTETFTVMLSNLFQSL